MEYHIIGNYKKEYHNLEYPTKYYLHTVEYPHIIQVDYTFFKEVLEKSIDSISIPHLKVTDYEGRYYYKYVTNGKE